MTLANTLKGNALREYKKTQTRCKHLQVTRYAITLNNREGALRARHSTRRRLHTFVPLSKGKSKCQIRTKYMLTISSIYIQCFTTLLEHLRKYGIFVAVAHRIDSLYGFELIELIVTQSSYSMMKSSIQPMNTKVYAEKKECLKIFTKLQEHSPIGSWMMGLTNRMLIIEPIDFRLTHLPAKGTLQV